MCVYYVYGKVKKKKILLRMEEKYSYCGLRSNGNSDLAWWML